MTLSRVVHQLAASRPARWLLLAAAVTGLLYGVSSLATWSVVGDAHLTAAGAATHPRAGPWYSAWRATAPPAAGTPPAGSYTLGHPLGPEPADFLARRSATLSRAMVPPASGAIVPATSVLTVGAAPDEALVPAEPLLAAQPTHTLEPPTAMPPPTQLPPASAPVLPSNTAHPIASNTPPPAPSNTTAPPIGLPTLPLPTLPLPTLPLPQPTATDPPPPTVAPPTNTPPPPSNTVPPASPTVPPLIVLPTLALPTLPLPTLPLPLP